MFLTILWNWSLPHEKFNLVCEAGDVRRVEQQGQRQLDVESVLNAREEAGRKQRMPSEIEKIVVDSDVFHTQHTRAGLSQLAFDGRTRSCIGPHFSCAGKVGFGEGETVDFSA